MELRVNVETFKTLLTQTLVTKCANKDSGFHIQDIKLVTVGFGQVMDMHGSLTLSTELGTDMHGRTLQEQLIAANIAS